MPRRNVIGVAPTIHPVHSRQVANRIGAFLLFFFFYHEIFYKRKREKKKEDEKEDDKKNEEKEEDKKEEERLMAVPGQVPSYTVQEHL